MKPVKLSLVCLFLFGLIALGSGCRDEQFHNIYNSDDERNIGNQQAQAVDSQVKLDQDAADNTRVQAVAQPIFAQAQRMRPDLVFTIKIIDSPEVNAFSISGGHLYIYTGLLDKLQGDDDALACVIGHESTHAVMRHVLKQMSDSGIKGSLVELLGITTNNYNLYNAAGAAYELEQLHYSREDEYQADKYGLMFAYDAGYDPNGAIRLFKKLEQLDKDSGATDAYAEDHPINKNRSLRALDLIKILRANGGVYPNDPNLAPGALTPKSPGVTIGPDGKAY